jgi:hypothetical protein
MYTKRHMRGRRSMSGFGALGELYNDETPCERIPTGDSYRKPGNYCATPDGGYTTFKADGSLEGGYPSTSNPTQSSTPSWLQALTAVLGAQQPTMPTVVPQGMSTTTKIALAGGAVLLVVLLTR